MRCTGPSETLWASWWSPPRSQPGAASSHILAARRAETAGVLVATAALSATAFSLGAPPAMLILPVLAWAAFRLNMIGAALAGVVIATLVNLMTRYGFGIFVDVDLAVPTRLALTQLFAVILVVALLIAQEVAGRTAGGAGPGVRAARTPAAGGDCRTGPATFGGTDPR